ncbi:hypothetical protein Ancab_023374 [Ancistrocladus abbreviatus]
MNSIQVAPLQPQVSLLSLHLKVRTISCAHKLPSLPCASLSPLNGLPRASLRLTKRNWPKYRQSSPVCLFGSKGDSVNGNQEPLWKALQKTLGNFGKKRSVEDILRQQIEKQEYYDDGGSGTRPPGGGGMGDSGGSEDEGFAATMDETVQVILATLGFIFLYIYIITGEELIRLAKDYIKYLLGGKKSVRLTRAMETWQKFFEGFSKVKEEDPYWLEREIINTETWWDSPEKYKRLLEAYDKSKSESTGYSDF